MTPEEAQSLGRAIRDMRVRQGLTQLKAANAAGVSVVQFGVWERGKYPARQDGTDRHAVISRDRLESVAAALDCQVADIANRAAWTASTRVGLMHG